MSMTDPKLGPRGLESRSFRLFAGTSVVHVICTVLAASMIIPFVWMLLTSIAPLDDVGKWIPTSLRWKNYSEVFDTSDATYYDGTVVRIDRADLTLVLRDRQDGTEKTFAVNRDTRVTQNGQMLAASKIQAEMEIRVAVPAYYTGQVVGVDRTDPQSASMVLRDPQDGAERTIPLDADTTLYLAGAALDPAKAEAGMDIRVKRPTYTDGKVLSIHKPAQKYSSLVLLDKKDGVEKTFPIDSDTTLSQEGKVLSASRIQAGMEIRVDRGAGKGIPFARFYWNSIFIAAGVTFLQVFTSSLAAFAFSRLEWRGRDRVFLLYLATMMLPGLVMMIPNYQIMIRLGLVDSYLGLILPAAFSAFGTFLLRQFMLTIPKSLDEAAEIDGASKWQVYWEVVLPLARPGLITLTIFTFLGTYRSFFWPLVMLKSIPKYTLPIGLMYFNSSRGNEIPLTMAAATMMIVPLIVLFVLVQKWLVKGIQLGAVKG